MKNKVISTILTAAVLVVGASQFTAMARMKDAVAQDPSNRSTERVSPTPSRDSIQVEPVNPSELPTTLDPSIVSDPGEVQYPGPIWCLFVPTCREYEAEFDELRLDPNSLPDSQPTERPSPSVEPSESRRMR